LLTPGRVPLVEDTPTRAEIAKAVGRDFGHRKLTAWKKEV